MTAQRPMSVVVAGLPTKSAKIKALIAEGYLRADVARFLDINYQHVRKVLEDAGIRDGLRNSVTATPRPAPAPKVRERMDVQILLDAGFTRLGTWTAAEGKIALGGAAGRGGVRVRDRQPGNVCWCDPRQLPPAHGQLSGRALRPEDELASQSADRRGAGGRACGRDFPGDPGAE